MSQEETIQEFFSGWRRDDPTLGPGAWWRQPRVCPVSPLLYHMGQKVPIRLQGLWIQGKDVTVPRGLEELWTTLFLFFSVTSQPAGQGVRQMKGGGPLLGLYNLLQLALAPLLAPPLVAYSLLRPKYRRVFFSRLGAGGKRSGNSGAGPRFWIHALSVGEVNSAIPLIKALAREWPNGLFFLSATTATGLEALKRLEFPIACELFAAPYDILPFVRRKIEEISPDLFILIETDIWPNLLWELKRAGIPSILANGSISSSAARRIRRIPGLVRLLYGGFSRIVMQSEDDARRLLLLGGIGEVMETPGNLKFDKTSALKGKGGGNPALFGLKARGERVIVAGSTHPGEEEEILAAFSTLCKMHGDVQLILAPRRPERGGELAAMAQKMGFSPLLRSSWEGGQKVKKILILDTLGELVHCYSFAFCAFVGGSMVPVGGHDLLEPAAFGVPVTFGPHVESCREVAQGLLTSGGGVMVKDGEELVEVWDALLRAPESALEMGQAAKGLVARNSGVVDRYVKIVRGLLAETSGET